MMPDKFYVLFYKTGPSRAWTYSSTMFTTRQLAETRARQYEKKGYTVEIKTVKWPK